MLVTAIVVGVIVGIILFGRSRPGPRPPSGGSGEDEIDPLVALDLLSDGRLDGHIGPREW